MGIRSKAHSDPWLIAEEGQNGLKAVILCTSKPNLPADFRSGLKAVARCTAAPIGLLYVDFGLKVVVRCVAEFIDRMNDRSADEAAIEAVQFAGIFDSRKRFVFDLSRLSPWNPVSAR